MFGKSLKYEWKDLSRVCLMLLLGLVAVTLIGVISFQAPVWQDAGFNSSGAFFYSSADMLVSILAILSLFLYLAMFFVTTVGTVAYVVVHFYQTTYKDRGYLTHTLPVSHGKMLFSKVLAGYFWVLIMLVLDMISLFILIVAMLQSMTGISIFEGTLWTSIWSGIRSFFQLSGVTVGSIILMVLQFFAGPMLQIITLFGVVSLGHLSRKHRVLMAVVSYIVVMIIENTVSSALGLVTANVVNLNQMNGVMQYVGTGTALSFGLQAVFALLLYLVSYYVVSRRLNLE